MSINVTVSANPIYVGRGKLLTDIETAKKNEWIRRRKIRIQQARQQAKDLLQNVRKKVSKEEDVIEKRETQKKACEGNRKKKESEAILKQELEECLSNVGSGHQLASLQAECDALLREKQELRHEIARARGAIAEERHKAEKVLLKEKSETARGRKVLTRKVEDLRSAMVSQLPPVAAKHPPPPPPQAASSLKSVRVQVHREGDEDIPATSQPTPRTGGSVKKHRHSSLRGGEEGGSMSDCHEEEESGEGSETDSDVTWPPRRPGTAAAGAARVVKERLPSPRATKVRFYDHTTRVATECPRPPYRVRSVDPASQPDMTEVIACEETTAERQEALQVLARREELIRGRQALRKEREHREAQGILNEIRDIEKRQRIQSALAKAHLGAYVSSRDPTECTTAQPRDDDESDMAVVWKEPLEEADPQPTTSYRDPCGLIDTREPRGAGLRRDTPSPQPDLQEDTQEFLQDLIEKLKEERSRKKEQLKKRFGVCDSPQEQGKLDDSRVSSKWDDILNKSTEDHRRKSFEEKCSSTVQEYVPKTYQSPDKTQRHSYPPETPKRSPERERRYSLSPTQAQPSVSDPTPQNQKSCQCAGTCFCRNVSRSERRSPDIEPIQYTDCNISEHYPEDKTLKPVHAVSSQETNSSLSETTSSHPETLKSCLTYEGVKVVVRVTDRQKKSKNRSPVKICTDKDVQTSIQDSPQSNNGVKEYNSTSTSFKSLPSNLSIENQRMLRYLMSKDVQMRNPILHSYIIRLLGMTRESIDDLPVSSVGDVSVHSSIFETNENGVVLRSRHDASVQVEDTMDEPYREEVLRFTELAQGYAARVQDLAGMIDGLNMFPYPRSQHPAEPEDTTYMNLPEDIQTSCKISNAIQPGSYPRPMDISDVPTGLYPHPDELNQQTQPTRPQRRACDRRRHDLSTIIELASQEMGFTPVGSNMAPPGPFDPNVSSIQGSPEKKPRSPPRGERHGPAGPPDENLDVTTSSSLQLLKDWDMAGSSLFGDSSDDFEEVFRSLGIAWALPTVRKVREARRKANTSSSSGGGGAGQYSHSTPLTQSPARPTGQRSRARSPTGQQRSSSEDPYTHQRTDPYAQRGQTGSPCVQQRSSSEDPCYTQQHSDSYAQRVQPISPCTQRTHQHPTQRRPHIQRTQALATTQSTQRTTQRSSPKSYNSDSLTPPTYSLTIPRLIDSPYRKSP